MIIGKINLGQSFEDGIPRWLKVDIDATPEPGETPEQVLDKIKQIIEGWQKMNNPHLHLDAAPAPGQSSPYDMPSPVINLAHERLLILIENAKSVVELESHRTGIEAANESRINQAFNEKWRSLMKQSKPELP